mmetsp:Transcript_83344/g.269600  ORF Transcript_83344/g.269600 Transcript_83344/m.269600 type:complete len:210 (+) Transcript_83344:267-896(+)
MRLPCEVPARLQVEAKGVRARLPGHGRQRRHGSKRALCAATGRRVRPLLRPGALALPGPAGLRGLQPQPLAWRVLWRGGCRRGLGPHAQGLWARPGRLGGRGGPAEQLGPGLGADGALLAQGATQGPRRLLAAAQDCAPRVLREGPRHVLALAGRQHEARVLDVEGRPLAGGPRDLAARAERDARGPAAGRPLRGKARDGLEEARDVLV